MSLVTTIAATDADSYATLAEYQSRAGAMGWTLSGMDATDEDNLRRAAVILDASYEWIGLKQYQFQALDWPRLVNVTVDDWPIDPDTVPGAIKDAQMELAFALQGGSDPTAAIVAPVKLERKKAGPLEKWTEYGGVKGNPRLPIVDRLVRDYVRAGAGQMRLARA